MCLVGEITPTFFLKILNLSDKFCVFELKKSEKKRFLIYNIRYNINKVYFKGGMLYE